MSHTPPSDRGRPEPTPILESMIPDGTVWTRPSARADGLSGPRAVNDRGHGSVIHYSAHLNPVGRSRAFLAQSIQTLLQLFVLIIDDVANSPECGFTPLPAAISEHAALDNMFLPTLPTQDVLRQRLSDLVGD